MNIKINLTKFFPNWNSRIVDKVWHFRDLAIFLFGGFSGWKEKGYIAHEQTMLIAFGNEKDAQNALSCLNGREGIIATLV